MKNVLTVISGPSGVGKGTIVKEILKRRSDVVASVSCTTRAPREGEVHGREYFFVSEEEFERRVKENGFLEYNKHFKGSYGTPRDFVEESLKEKSVILEIEVNGALKAKKAAPDALLIMIAPPSVEELRRRLIGRGTETEEEVETRLARVQYELSKADEYDYVVVNDDLERAIEEVNALIDKAKKQK